MKRIILVTVLLFLAIPSFVFAGSQATSGITAQTIVNRLTQDVNDSSGTLASSDEIVRWVDEATRKIVTESRCLEETEYITISSGEVAYSITTAHYDVSAVYLDAGVDVNKRYTWLAKIDPKSLFDNPQGVGKPVKWFEWQSNLFLYPIPDATGNVRVLMIKKPATVSSVSSAIETPFYFDEAILMWCCYKYFKKDAKDQKAAFYRAQFQQELAMYRAQIRKPLVPEVSP